MGEPNYEPLDAFSALHAAMGGIAGAAGAGLGPTLAVSLVWELAEPSLKRTYPASFPSASRDTLANKVGDFASVGAGWWAARAVKRRFGG